MAVWKIRECAAWGDKDITKGGTLLIDVTAREERERVASAAAIINVSAAILSLIKA